MDTEFNDLFNMSKKIMGNEFLEVTIANISHNLKDVVIEGRGFRRERLGLSAKNISMVMKSARFKKISTGIGHGNFKIFFPEGFSDQLSLMLRMINNFLIEGCYSKKEIASMCRSRRNALM